MFTVTVQCTLNTKCSIDVRDDFYEELKALQRCGRDGSTGGRYEFKPPTLCMRALCFLQLPCFRECDIWMWGHCVVRPRIQHECIVSLNCNITHEYVVFQEKVCSVRSRWRRHWKLYRTAIKQPEKECGRCTVLSSGRSAVKQYNVQFKTMWN